MIKVQIKIKDLISEGAFGMYCEYRGWELYSFIGGNYDEDEWVEVPLKLLKEWGV